MERLYKGIMCNCDRERLLNMMCTKDCNLYVMYRPCEDIPQFNGYA